MTRTDMQRKMANMKVALAVVKVTHKPRCFEQTEKCAYHAFMFVSYK